MAPRPIRPGHFRLRSASESVMSQYNSPIRINSLICHKHVQMGLECLGSLRTCCKDDHELVLHDDGSLTERDRELLAELSPTEIITREEADDRVLPQLSSYPNCRKYRTEHPLGIKLIDIPLLNERSFAYCDTDILFIKPFAGIDLRKESNIDYVYMLDRKEGYSIRFIHRWITSSRIRFPEKVNTGFTFLNQKAYDLDFFDWFLGQPEYRLNDFMVEQTAWAAFAARSKSRAWDPEQVKVPDSARYSPDDNETVALHFISPIRSWYNPIKNKVDVQNSGQLDVTLKTQPANYTTLAQAFKKRLVDKIKI